MQKILFQRHRNDYFGYELNHYPHEIWLPFWELQSKIIVDESVPVDELSKIFLGLIDNGITSHSRICEFLGVDEDSFIFMHMNFLMTHGLVRYEGHGYEITHDGESFLNGKATIRQNRTVNFECFYNESDEKFYLDTLPSSRKFCEPLSCSIPHEIHVGDISIVDFAKFYNSLKNGETGVFYEMKKYFKYEKKFFPVWLLWYSAESETKLKIREFGDGGKLSLSKYMKDNVRNMVNTEWLVKMEKAT